MIPRTTKHHDHRDISTFLTQAKNRVLRLLQHLKRNPGTSPTSLQTTGTNSYALKNLSEEAVSPRTACALLSTLVLHFDGPARTRQLERIAWYGDEPLMTEILRLEPQVVVLSPDERLALVPTAIKGLWGLPAHRRHRFMANLRSLINADDAVSLFEYTLLLQVESGLEAPGSDPKPAPTNLDEVKDQLITLIAVLARAVSQDEATARRAYEAAMRSLSSPHRTLPPYRASFERLSGAMRELRRVSPPFADRILDACEVVIAHGTGTKAPPPSEYGALLQGLRGCFSHDSNPTSSDHTAHPENLSPAS